MRRFNFHTTTTALPPELTCLSPSPASFFLWHSPNDLSLVGKGLGPSRNQGRGEGNAHLPQIFAGPSGFLSFEGKSLPSLPRELFSDLQILRLTLNRRKKNPSNPLQPGLQLQAHAVAGTPIRWNPRSILPGSPWLPGAPFSLWSRPVESRPRQLVASLEFAPRTPARRGSPAPSTSEGRKVAAARCTWGDLRSLPGSLSWDRVPLLSFIRQRVGFCHSLRRRSQV